MYRQRSLTTSGTARVFTNMAPMKNYILTFFTKNDNGTRAKCNLCANAEISTPQCNTTNNTNHLRSHHPSEFKEFEKKKTESKENEETINRKKLKIQQFAAPSGTSSYTRDSAQQKDITRAVAKLICVDMRPISIVEDFGFSELLHTLDFRYRLPVRTTISRQIINNSFAFKQERGKPPDFFNQNPSPTLAVSSDIWTSRRGLRKNYC